MINVEKASRVKAFLRNIGYRPHQADDTGSVFIDKMGRPIFIPCDEKRPNDRDSYAVYSVLAVGDLEFAPQTVNKMNYVRGIKILLAPRMLVVASEGVYASLDAFLDSLPRMIERVSDACEEIENDYLPASAEAA